MKAVKAACKCYIGKLKLLSTTIFKPLLFIASGVHRKISGRILLSSILLTPILLLIPFPMAQAQSLPDATQNFTGYSKMEDGTDRMISPDNYFILSASRNDRLNADDFGAYISDMSQDHGGITDWFEINVNPDSDLGSFELTDVFVGEYDYGVTVLRFEDVVISAYQGVTLIAETAPYASQSDDEETRYPIDYSVFEGKSIDRFRVTFTTKNGTPPDTFNLVEFTIKEASIEEPTPTESAGVLLSSSPTLTFTENSADITEDNIASDGEGGSQAISDIDIQIFNISDEDGTFLNSLDWKGPDFLFSGDPNFSALTYDNNNQPNKGMAVKSADGSAFRFIQFTYYNWGEAEPFTNTIKGYRNGTEVASMTFEGFDPGYVPITVTLDASFSNVDDVRIFISDGGGYGNGTTNHSINNIQVSSPVLNSAPTDITLSSTSVEQSAGVNATVGQLSTVDTDQDDTHIYSLVSGDGDTDNASFNISGDELRVNDASSMASGDYSVRIQTDDGTDTFSKAFTITIIAPSSLGDAIVYVEHLKQGDPGIDRMGGASDPVVSPDGRHVYVAAYTSSAINIFSRDAASGELTPAGAVVHNMGGVQHMQSAFSVDISPDGKHVYVGSPTSHAVVVLARNENTGQLTFVESNVTASEVFTVGGFIMVSVSPDGKSVYGVGGSGIKGLVVFDRNPETGRLTYVEEHIAGQNGNKLDQGFSPTASPINNIDFSAAGDYLYITSTVDHAVSVYARNTDTGSLTLEQVAENLVNGVMGIEAASSLVVSPDENFVYVSGQGQNAVSVFSRNQDTGHITYIEHYSNGTGGISTMEQARSLAMSPDGRYLYVSAIQSNAITVFERNIHTGSLSLAASRVNGQDGVLGIATVSGMVTDPLNQHLYSAGQGEHAIAVFSLPIPGIVLASVTATADESGPAVTLDDQLLIFDSDDTHLQSGSVTIESGFKPGDQLHVNTQGGVTADYNADTGVLTLFGFATLETYRDILRTVRFQAGSDPDIGAGETAERNIAFRVNDGDNESAPAVVTVTVHGTSGPAVVSFSPPHETTGVDRESNLSITFDKDFVLGSEGTFRLYAADDETPFAIFDLTDAGDRDLFSVSVDNRTLTLSHGLTFPVNETFTVAISSGFVEDDLENSFPGFDRDSQTWYFTTEDLTSQTIAFTEVEGKTYGDDQFQLGPETSSEGLTVTYTAEDEEVISIAGNMATILKAGSTNVTATQPGNESIAPAVPVEQAVTIAKAELTITVNEEQSKTYGDDDPEFSFTATGFRGGDEGLLMGSLSREEGESVGSYAISQGGLSAGENYSIEFIPSDFEIIPGILLISVTENQGKIYGDEDPGFGFEAEGFRKDDDSSVLEGSLSREPGQGAGTYVITQGSLDAGEDYTIELISSEFTIYPRPLSVWPHENQGKIYGEDDPELELHHDELKFNDDSTIFSGSLIREEGESAGTYEIGLGSLATNQNYSIEFQPDVFSISRRTLMVSADEGQWKYVDEEDPEITYTAENFVFNDGDEVFAGLLSREQGEDRGLYVITQGSLETDENYDIEFQTAEFRILYPLPIVAEINPEEGSENISVQPQVIITFDQTIEAVDTGLISIESESHSAQNVSAEISDHILTLSHHDLENLTKYTIHIPEGTVQNIDGIANQEFSSYFTTIISNPGISEILSPSDNETAVNLTPELEWAEADYAEYYHLQISSSEDFSELVLEAKMLDTLVFQVTEKLDRNTRYFLRVRAENMAGYGEWSQPFSFRTVPEPPPAVVLTSPEDGSPAVELHPTLVWQETDRADAYQVQVTAGTDFTNELIIDVSNLEEIKLELAEELNKEATFSWRVRAINAGGAGEWSRVWTFTTIPMQPAQVVLTSPVDSVGSVSLLPEFTWEVANRADAYEIQIADNDEFSNPVVLADNISEITYKATTELDEFQGYYWRVRSLNPGGTGDWSEAGTFVTIARSPAAEFPEDGSRQISTAPTFSWATIHSDTRFEFELVNEAGDTTVLESTFASQPVSGLDPEAIYTWRVRINDEVTSSDWSNPAEFSTRPNPVDPVVELSVGFGREKAELSELDYRLVGLPGDDNLNFDRIMSGNYKDDWRVFRDAGGYMDYYEEFDPESNAFTFIPGEGFWVFSRDSVVLDFEITPSVPDGEDAYYISLNTGWNIISNPFNVTIAWQEVLDFNKINTDLLSYEQAYLESGIMVPGVGYYFFNDPELEMDKLAIPYSPTEKRISDTGQDGGNLIAGSENLAETSRVSITGSFVNRYEEILTVQAHLEYGNEATTGKHPGLEMVRYGLAFLADEEISGRDRLYRRYTDWYDEAGTKYLMTVKAPVGEKLKWQAEFTGLGPEAAILLVNPVTNQSHLLSGSEVAEVTVSEPEVTYSVFTGNRAYLDNIQDNLLPQEITLEQNYPNPFNPTTNIRYSLVDDANVRLEVFDVLGRRVQLLVDGHQSKGWHIAHFDGSQLASGIYIYRLSTDKNSMLTGKMMLVK